MSLSRKTKRNLLKKQKETLNVKNSQEAFDGKLLTWEIPNNDEIAKQIESKIQRLVDVFDGIDEETSEYEISELFSDVLTYNFEIPPQKDDFRLISSSYISLPDPIEFLINEGQYCYRIRENSDSMECNMKNFSLDDFWNPPKEFTSLGRLNQINHPVLYVAESPITAFREMKFEVGSEGYLNVYKAVEQLSLRFIGYNSTDKLYLIMKRLFAENVKVTEKYKYKLTQEIANRFFPYNEYNFDGWAYPSIANDGDQHNAAIDISKKKKLELVGALKFRVITERIIEVHHLVVPVDGNPFYVTNENSATFGNFDLGGFEDVLRLLTAVNQKYK